MKNSFLFCIFLVLFSCAFYPSPTKEILVLNWNLQNLFDDQFQGTEYKSFVPSEDWKTEDYHWRLKAFAQALESIEEGFPDVLALQEVENRGVLEDLGEYFPWVPKGIWFSSEVLANGPGIISRYPLAQVGEILTPEGRPMLEATLFPGEREIRLWVVHWKSRIPSPGATEPLRLQSARALGYRFRSLSVNPDPKNNWMILGDFNSWVEEPYAQEQGTWGSGGLGSGYAFDGSGVFFKASAGAKTYFYQDQWYALDHVFLTQSFQDGWGWEWDWSKVLVREPFLRKEIPHSYQVFRKNGLSDHLPLLTRLIWKE